MTIADTQAQILGVAIVGPFGGGIWRGMANEPYLSAVWYLEIYDCRHGSVLPRLPGRPLSGRRGLRFTTRHAVCDVLSLAGEALAEEVALSAL